MPERLLQVGASFRSRQGFPSRDRVSGPMSHRGSLCRDMVLRLQAVAWSRQCHDIALFLYRDDVAIKVSMS